jgi:hypothetical protein
VAIDVNDAPEQRPDGLIPDGSFVKVALHIRPGGISNPTGDPEQDALDQGLFKDSASSDTIYLDTELKVIQGPYRGMAIWPFFGVAGGSLEANGSSKAANVTRQNLRAILNSALGLDPKDKSEQAHSMRILRGYADLDNIEFYVRVGVQKGGPSPSGGTYPDKNTMAHIVEPHEPEWALLSQDKEVPPAARGARGGSAAAQGAQAAAGKPAWQRTGAPAAVPNGATAVLQAQTTAPVPAPSAVPTAGPAWLKR